MVLREHEEMMGLFHHEARKGAAELLVRHLLVRGRNFVQQFTHEGGILICSRLLEPLAPRLQIKKHNGQESLQVKYCH